MPLASTRPDHARMPRPLVFLLAGGASALAVGGAPGGARVVGSTVQSPLAIGCPICKALVVAVLGVSGALGARPLVLIAVAVLSCRGACARGCAAGDRLAEPVAASGSAQ